MISSNPEAGSVMISARVRYSQYRSKALSERSGRVSLFCHLECETSSEQGGCFHLSVSKKAHTRFAYYNWQYRVSTGLLFSVEPVLGDHNGFL